jgi:hypothetical protein
MIITEKNLISMMKDKEAEKISTLYLNNKNIGSISLKNHFYRVEFLSLQNNSIKDISFLKNLPNLWYLDIRMNPIESYEVVNTINCFGYLGLSVEKYSEKKILSIKKINVGIMNLSIDEYYKKGFMLSNQNIIKFNDEILYHHDKLSGLAAVASSMMSQQRGHMQGAFARASIDASAFKSFSSFLGLNSSHGLKSMNSQNTVQSIKNNISDNNLTNSPNYIRRVSYANTIFSNDKAKNLSEFFSSFNNELSNLMSNPIILINNLNNPDFFFENVSYLGEERKKLKLLAQIYESLLLLNRNENFVFRLSYNDQVSGGSGNFNSDFNEKNFKEGENLNIGQKNNHNTNENNANIHLFSDANLFSIKTLNFSYFKIKETPIQIIILTILILYILQITGKEFSLVLIKYIFKNFLHLNLHSLEIKAFLELETEYLLGVYFDVYDNFKESYSKVAQISEKITPEKQSGNSLTNFNFNPSNKNSMQKQSSKIDSTTQILTSENLSSNLEVQGKIQENFNVNELYPQPTTTSNTLDKLKYEEIFKCLEMNSLILKCNILNKTKSEASKIYSLKNDLEMRKVLINSTLIKLLDDELKIFDEILNLIQYLNDFILFHKIDTVLLKDYTLQYRVFIEMKGLMFIHLNKKTKCNLIYNTLTDRKYTDHKYKRLGNKLFFIKNPVGKEKQEKDLNKMQSFLSGMDFNFNKEHKKKEIGKKIDIKRSKECLKENSGGSKEKKDSKGEGKNFQNYQNQNYLLHSSNYILQSSNTQNLEHHSSTGFNFNSNLNSGKSTPKKNLKFFGVSLDSIDKDTIYSNIPQSEMDKLLRTTKIKCKSTIRSGSNEKQPREKFLKQEKFDSGFKRHNSNSLNSLIKNPLLNVNHNNVNSTNHELHYINEENTTSINSKISMKNYQMYQIKPQNQSSDSYFINESVINKSEYFRIPKSENYYKYNGLNKYNFLPQFNNSAAGTAGTECNSIMCSPKNSLLQKSSSPKTLSEIKKKTHKFLTSKLNFGHLGHFRRIREKSPSNLVLNSSSNLGNKNSLKTIYDFKSNYKKLVHHWNENNPHASHADLSSNKDFSVSIGRSSSEAATELMKFNNKKNSSQAQGQSQAQGDNFMTAEDIFNLFSIQNKNDDLKSK